MKSYFATYYVKHGYTDKNDLKMYKQIRKSTKAMDLRDLQEKIFEPNINHGENNNKLIEN